MQRILFAIMTLFLWEQLLGGSRTEATQRLFEAVGDMKLAAVAEAIEAGADVNATDEDGWPIFITAINTGQMGIIRLFLSRPTLIIDQAGPDGKTALMHAISMKNSTLAEILIQKGADLNATDQRGKTPLMYAAEVGDEKLINLLLSRGADRNQKSSEGKTALDYAMDARRKGAIEILGKFDRLPLEMKEAVARGDGAAVRKLIANGASPDGKMDDGKPFIVYAVEKGYLDVLRALIEGKADVNGKYFKGSTLLMFAFHKNQLGAAELILRSGGEGDLNFKYKEGKTALMMAIEQNRPMLVNLLLGKRLQLNVADSYGRTALFYAVERGDADLVDRLLSLGADPTVRQFEGKTALEVAREKGHQNIVKMLQMAEAAHR